jgi:hypothetical protein
MEIAHMPNERQKLTDASLQKFVTRIQKDPTLKKEIVDKIKTDGIAKVVREFFVLSDIQEKNVSTLKTPMERQLANLVIEAVNSSGGTIRLLPPDTTLIQPLSPGITVVGHDGPDGTDFSVDVHCLQ